MPSTKPESRRTSKAGPDPARRRFCYYCEHDIDDVDYKDPAALRRMVSEKGKIRSRRITGTCRRHQNQVTVAVKRAREVALLPTATR